MAGKPAPLSGKEDGGRPLIVVAASALVDIDALLIDAADFDCLSSGLIECVSVMGLVIKRNEPPRLCPRPPLVRSRVDDQQNDQQIFF